MARGLIRKPSFWKIVGAFRSQWKRALKRLFIPGYGKRGMGWWRDPKRAWYNWWYHRTSVSVYRLFGCKPSRGACAIAMTVALFCNLFAAPVDVAKATSTAFKIKKARKKRAANKKTSTSAPKKKRRSDQEKTASTRTTTPRDRTEQTASASRSTSPKETEKKTPAPAAQASPRPSNPSSKQPQAQPRQTAKATTETVARTPAPKAPKVTYIKPNQEAEERAKPKPASVPAVPELVPLAPATPARAPRTEPDENAPKSTPKNEKDRYIRKRMIIAGSSYCDKDALNRLTIGSYLDLVAEPDNPYDKDAVMLVHEGQKVGYVSKTDRAPYAASLRLGRPIYGVVTDIAHESVGAKYEFETWFGQNG